MRQAGVGLALAVLAACGIDRSDPAVQRALPERAHGIQAPRLGPLEGFDAPQQNAAPSLAQTQADLDARLAALRARADALSGPVLSPSDQRKLAR